MQAPLAEPFMARPLKTLEIRRSPLCRSRGQLTFGAITVPCALGKSGTTRFKREGDGATPIGPLKPLEVYYRADRGLRPRTALPVRQIDRMDGWCDDPRHPRYNRPVRLPFGASHETMWREDRLYDIVVTLDWNMYPAVAGQGSAIFFHIAREDYRPTEGCVAVAPQHMRLLLEKLDQSCLLEVF